ncbi:MAG TPA: protein phosphatase 2C domain-containing protein [Candidatus Acidoferrales bacterium]|jgi:protein phosphatase|nr:protein phosphatase 2C domain-containing protein [Candidatus Acidoferrales bacterium]
MDLEFAELSDLGRVRQGNEDYLGHAAPSESSRIRSHGWLFVLADGVGGHDRGEVASRTAVESIVNGFLQAAAGEPHPGLLGSLVQKANKGVIDAGQELGGAAARMATTVVTCALRYNRAVIAHVGDSRCYLTRKGQTSILTRDHTIAQEHVKLGLLSANEVENAETRHVLSRCLGGELIVAPEVNEHEVFAEDVLVLCSDGLHNSVTTTEIGAVTGHGGDLSVAARRLVDIANQRDGSDNISLQLIRIRSVERVGMYRGRPYLLR